MIPLGICRRLIVLEKKLNVVKNVSQENKNKIDSIIEGSCEGDPNTMIYKGSVNTYEDLPLTGNKIGDTYDVKDTGVNYTWNGEKWDDESGLETLTSTTPDQVDSLFNS